MWLTQAICSRRPLGDGAFRSYAQCLECVCACRVHALAHPQQCRCVCAAPHYESAMSSKQLGGSSELLHRWSSLIKNIYIYWIQRSVRRFRGVQGDTVLTEAKLYSLSGGRACRWFRVWRVQTKRMRFQPTNSDGLQLNEWPPRGFNDSDHVCTS